jgi:hypothetical protein
MPYNLRPLPQYPWRSQVPALPASELPIGLHRNKDTPAFLVNIWTLIIIVNNRLQVSLNSGSCILTRWTLCIMSHVQGSSQAPQMVRVFRTCARTIML